MPQLAMPFELHLQYVPVYSKTSRTGSNTFYNLIPEAEKRVEPKQALQGNASQNSTNSQLQSTSQIKPKSQEITSNQARTSNKESLEKQAYCFGAFNGLQNLNVGFNQSGNNEYFKRYKKEFYDVYTPIMDKIEQCQRANRDTSMNMALQCAKKMSEKEYRLFRESITGYMDVYEASRQRDMMKIGVIRGICSIIQ